MLIKLSFARSLPSDQLDFFLTSNLRISFHAIYLSNQANGLKQCLTDEFKENVKVVMKQDAGTTGNFEVTLVETNELIHSKKGGKGKCESTSERAAVVEKINEFLSK